MTLEPLRTASRGGDSSAWALYVIEISPPLRHCRFYVGITNNVARRLEQHRAGQGARCLEVATQRGSRLEVVATFRAGWNYQEARALERKVKSWNHNSRLAARGAR